jgi:hypothetical protein
MACSKAIVTMAELVAFLTLIAARLAVMELNSTLQPAQPNEKGGQGPPFQTSSARATLRPTGPFGPARRKAAALGLC